MEPATKVYLYDVRAGTVLFSHDGAWEVRGQVDGIHMLRPANKPDVSLEDYRLIRRFDPDVYSLEPVTFGPWEQKGKLWERKLIAGHNLLNEESFIHWDGVTVVQATEGTHKSKFFGSISFDPYDSLEDAQRVLDNFLRNNRYKLLESA